MWTMPKEIAERPERRAKRDSRREMGASAGENLENLGHPQECESGVDDGERQGAGASSSGPEEGEPGGELDEGGEIGERLAEGYVRAHALPCGGEVARNQAEKAEEDGAGRVGVNAEIGCEAAVLHGSLAPVSGGKGLRTPSE